MSKSGILPFGSMSRALISCSVITMAFLLCLSGCGSGGNGGSGGSGGGGGNNGGGSSTAAVAGNVLIRVDGLCGYSAAPSVTVSVSINTNPVQTTTTDSNGNFSFTTVPYGSYTVTPSLAGASAVFAPATQSVSVAKGGALTSFNAMVGYSVSGTVSYAGNATGPINLVLQRKCPSGFTQISSLGTMIPAPGAFTINGVPPGTYTVQSWRDVVSDGMPNASDPTGGSAVFTIAAQNQTGVSVALTDPAAVTFDPAYLGVVPFDQGAALGANLLSNSTPAFWQMIGGSYLEKASSYTLQWSTDPNFGTLTGTKSYPAAGQTMWVLPGLANGQQLYFRFQGVAGAATSSWSSVVGPVTIGAPAGSVLVSGNVTFGSPATGPLYLSFTNESTPGHTYYAQIASPISPQSYSIQLSPGTYYVDAFIDQNNDDVEDNGDMRLGGNSVFPTFSGTSATHDLSMNGGGIRYLSLGTENIQDVNEYGASIQGYSNTINAWDGSKKVEAIEVTRGPQYHRSTGSLAVHSPPRSLLFFLRKHCFTPRHNAKGWRCLQSKAYLQRWKHGDCDPDGRQCAGQLRC